MNASTIQKLIIAKHRPTGDHPIEIRFSISIKIVKAHKSNPSDGYEQEKIETEVSFLF